MIDEEEAKMKKMRMRIERDAYSVLLSFKDGASPIQVERRMEETLGYTYNSKYYQAGVYDMSQILREHPQVRVNYDGKFKIIANEDNQDLVNLISKQKENKKKRGGNSQRGRRPMTAIGHHRNTFGGFQLRTSPKVSAGMRPLTSMGKPSSQRPHANINRPLSTAPVLRPSVKIGGVTDAHRYLSSFSTPARSSAVAKALPPVPVQRPLVRPTVTSSISSNVVTQTSSTASIRVPSPTKPPQHTGYIPSIKEFTENAKLMMLKLYPDSIHLSELTDYYSQEYGVTVEPLQLFSKSWMVLIKTTFKECLQMENGEVSLKEDWYKKYGASFKKNHIPKVAPTPTTLPAPYSKKEPIIAPVPLSDIRSTLPISQGFRYQIPTPKSPVEIVRRKMKGLSVGAHKAMQSPEKPPGVSPKPVSTTEKLFTNHPPVLETVKQQLSSTVDRGQMPLPNGASYDVKQLKSLKFVEKNGNVKLDVDTALNENPELKKVLKKNVRNLYSSGTSLPSQASKNAVHIVKQSQNDATSNGLQPDTLQPLETPTPTQHRTRSTASNALSSRIFGRALAEIHKQNDIGFPSRHSESEQKPLYVAPSLDTTTVPNRYQEAKSTKAVDSDDGWSSLLHSQKNVQTKVPPVTGRKLMLPPMSKGANPKPQLRSRPSSRTRSVSSQDTMNATIERAMNATLPDDDQW